MKRFKKFLVLLAGAITVVCLAVGLAGCSSNENDNAGDVNGNMYTFSNVSISISGTYANYFTEEELAEMEAEECADMEGATISFADGIAIITMYGESETYSYAKDGSTIMLYYEGEEDGEYGYTMTLTVSNDNIIMEGAYVDVYGSIVIKYTFEKV